MRLNIMSNIPPNLRLGLPKYTCRNCEQVKKAVENWIKQEGQNKCHYYPVIFREICGILGVDLELEFDNLCDKEEFKEGCEKYREEIYEKMD